MEIKIQYQTKNRCYIKGEKLKPKGIMLHSTACPRSNGSNICGQMGYISAKWK